MVLCADATAGQEHQERERSKTRLESFTLVMGLSPWLYERRSEKGVTQGMTRAVTNEWTLRAP